MALQVFFFLYRFSTFQGNYVEANTVELFGGRKCQVKECYPTNFLAAFSFPKILSDLNSHAKGHKQNVLNFPLLKKFQATFYLRELEFLIEFITNF